MPHLLKIWQQVAALSKIKSAVDQTKIKNKQFKNKWQMQVAKK